MKIKKNDLLSIDKYIEEALYNKKFGYYMNKNPFGSKGDFITAPNISIMFSEMIAIWIISFWESLKFPKKFNLIELGPGNGEMMKVLIKTFDQFPEFKSACKISILEKSNFLKKIQKENIKKSEIKWIRNLNEVNSLPSIFIANEFFDALPIKQFIKKKKKLV
jgi:NADH dehydrogenase [ubiquinone] 1 alpha subcomplex assembly factor 7